MLNLNLSAASLPATKRAPKKHRAYCYMLRTGINGFTENDILFNCRLSSGRNYPNELERDLGICFVRTKEKNPDGIGGHFRYRFTNRADVIKVIRLVNFKASIGKYASLSPQEIIDILNLYPELLNAA